MDNSTISDLSGLSEIEKRHVFFQTCCNKLTQEFKEISFENESPSKKRRGGSNFLKQILSPLKSTSIAKHVEFVIDKNAADLINDNYWFLIENIARKIISSGKEEKESVVDLYKILSITEFSVVVTKPVVLELSEELGSNIQDGNKLHEQLSTIEKLVNVYFGWVCAYEYLTDWTSLKDLTFDPKLLKEKTVDEIWENILFFKEDIKEREHSLSIYVEHMRIISYVTESNLPIWTNAMWWRLLLLHLQHRVNNEVKKD